MSGPANCPAELVVKLSVVGPGFDFWSINTAQKAVRLQASNHRVKLWHATKETYQDLSDNQTQSDPIHLFPGGLQIYHSATGLCLIRFKSES